MIGYIEGIIILIEATLTDPAFIIQSSESETGLHGRMWIDLERRGPHDYYSDINITPEGLIISMDKLDEEGIRVTAADITISPADPTWLQQLHALYTNWITECRHE